MFSRSEKENNGKKWTKVQNFRANHITNVVCALFVSKSSRSELYCRNPKTVKYGTETLSYLAPKIWSLIPQVMKSCKSLDAFKSKIRQWEPDYPSLLCET